MLLSDLVTSYTISTHFLHKDLREQLYCSPGLGLLYSCSWVERVIHPLSLTDILQSRLRTWLSIRSYGESPSIVTVSSCLSVLVYVYSNALFSNENKYQPRSKKGYIEATNIV